MSRQPAADRGAWWNIATYQIGSTFVRINTLPNQNIKMVRKSEPVLAT